MSHFLVNRVGSLVVNKYDEIMGIVAPVDVLETVHKDPVNISTMMVREVMSEDVIVASPDELVEALMAIMTENRILHIPIQPGETGRSRFHQRRGQGPVGRSRVQVSYLKDYIEAKYPA